MIVHKLRLQKGWSQESLAEISGLSVRTIQRIENGQKASPESLKALGAVFNIDFNVLMESKMNNDQVQPNHQTISHEEMMALRHVRKLRGFYIHLAQYCVIITMLLIINLFTNPRYLWVIFPALGWGIGLLIHGLSVFKAFPFLGVEWEKRQVEKYLGRKL